MDNDMNARLTILETKLETILPTLATKGDLSDMKAAIVMWVALVTLSAAALNIAVMVFMLNRALPQQPQVTSGPQSSWEWRIIPQQSYEQPQKKQ